MNNFSVGELIIYVNGDVYEIGKVKRVCDDGCFVFYHDGETTAKTSFSDMHKLVNAHNILTTNLGGHNER